MKFPLSRDEPFRVGIAAFAALGVLGLVVIAISVVPFGARTYQAEFGHTAGLRATEGVQIAGVEVGEVRKVEVEGNKVIVTFTVSDDIELGSRTEASVKVGTLLGTHFLDIVPKGSGELASDTIPLAHTSVPFNLQDVIDKGTGAVDQIDATKISEALSVVADTLKVAGPQLGPAFRGVARLSKMITARDEQIGELLEASRLISDQLSSGTADLVKLMKQSNLVIGELVRRRAAIRDLLGDITSVTASINQIMDDNEKDLKPLLTDLDTVVGILVRKDDDLRRALHNLAVTSRYFANATGDGPFVNLFLTDPLPDKVRCGPTGGC